MSHVAPIQLKMGGNWRGFFIVIMYHTHKKITRINLLRIVSSYFAIQVWCIWHQRNQSRLHQPCCLTKDLKLTAQDRWDEVRSCYPLPIPTRPQPKPKWSVPPSNKYKINYDGAISEVDNISGIGVIVRNCNSEVIASLVQQVEQAFQPLQVEAIAACRAVEFGSEIGVDCAIVEGDSEVLIKTLRNTDNGLNPIAPLINDVSLFSNLYSELSSLTLREMATKSLIV